MSIECRNLRFNLEKKTDRQARDILQAVPMGQRNQFILNAICSYGEEQTEEERQERFAQRVAEIVMDGLSDIWSPERLQTRKSRMRMCRRRAWPWSRTSSPVGPNRLHNRYESGAIFHTIFPKKSSDGATIRTIRWLLFCGVKCLKTDRSFAYHLRRWADKGSHCRRLFFLSQRLASRTFVCTNVESRGARSICAPGFPA